MAALAFAYASPLSPFFALFQDQGFRSFRPLTLAHSLRYDAPVRVAKAPKAQVQVVPITALEEGFTPLPISFCPLPLFGGGLKELVEMPAPTTHRGTVASPILKAVAGPLRTSIQRYPYEVPSHAVPVLQRFGIEASGFGFKAHPHPVRKMIEIHLLFEHWLNLCRSPSAVLFMKQSKFEKLQHENANFEALANYNLTARDTTRYEQVAAAPPTQSVWFMHDALQYFSLSQVAAFFADCPHPEKLFASLVVPPESDFTNLSLFPEIYRYSFAGSRLNYQLEGNPGHSYRQPREALEWLKTTTIRSGSLCLTVTKLESWGPVHSLIFTVDPPRAKSLTQLIGPYRHARLLSLEAILMPTLNAFQNPVTVHMVWTVHTVQPASGEELFYPGGQALTVGGPVSMSALATVPADVSRLNPVIKGAVAFLDTPRLTGTTMKCAKSETSPMAYVVTRGTLALSGPVGTRLSE